MKSFVKISVSALVALLLFTTVSCKKEPASENIYQLLSGIWETDRDGAPVLYLIGSEEIKMYMYTYPHPIDEIDQDAGTFEVNTQDHTILFTNARTQTPVTNTYELSNRGNTLKLNNTTYKRID